MIRRIPRQGSPYLCSLRGTAREAAPEPERPVRRRRVPSVKERRRGLHPLRKKTITSVSCTDRKGGPISGQGSFSPIEGKNRPFLVKGKENHPPTSRDMLCPRAGVFDQEEEKGKKIDAGRPSGLFCFDLPAKRKRTKKGGGGGGEKRESPAQCSSL